MRLDDQRVAQEVGKQYPSWRATKKELEDYGTALESLKKDLKKFAANQYSKICLKKAAVLQMKTKENCIVTNWTAIGSDFASSPTWSKAIALFHTLYTSMDECPEFKINVEREWMKNNGIVYTEEYPQGTREITGICSMITHKVCGLRKDINKRVSKNMVSTSSSPRQNFLMENKHGGEKCICSNNSMLSMFLKLEINNLLVILTAI
jgi:hypothetical protein